MREQTNTTMTLYDELDDIVTDLSGISALLFNIADCKDAVYNYEVSSELYFLSKSLKNVITQLGNIEDKIFPASKDPDPDAVD